MTIRFDTLRFVDKLIKAGVPEAQAKAEAEALVFALAESASETFASRDDITGIKLDLVEIKSEQKLMKWMLGLILAGVLTLVMKSFF